MPVNASSLPTLARLYEAGQLAVPASTASRSLLAPEPSAALNDRIVLWQGDITQLQIDNIVNAANARLLGGGGVDGAIHRAAGSRLLTECSKLKGCRTGQAKATGAYNLPSRRIIHTVGPIYDKYLPAEARALLTDCYRNSLKLAVEKADEEAAVAAKKAGQGQGQDAPKPPPQSVAFCSISTGVYGFPLHDAARTAVTAVREFLEGPRGNRIDRVVFVVFLDEDVAVYKKWLSAIFPPAPVSKTAGAEQDKEASEDVKEKADPLKELDEEEKEERVTGEDEEKEETASMPQGAGESN